jgi:hypothetical protein
MKLENSILRIQIDYNYSMATKTKTPTRALILATFALMI